MVDVMKNGSMSMVMTVVLNATAKVAMNVSWYQ